MHKINIFILLAGILFFSSCKKNHDAAAVDTISTSIDGQTTTFNVGVHASTLTHIAAKTPSTVKV